MAKWELFLLSRTQVYINTEINFIQRTVGKPQIRDLSNSSMQSFLGNVK